MAQLKITIKKGGEYTITAGEGFQGTSCIKKLRILNNLLV